MSLHFVPIAKSHPIRNDPSSTQKNGYWEIFNLLTLYYSVRLCKTLTEMVFENIMGKGDNADKQYDFYLFNSLPNDKILDWSKFKAFADDKINVGYKLKTVYGKVENIVRKGENAGY